MEVIFLYTTVPEHPVIDIISNYNSYWRQYLLPFQRKYLQTNIRTTHGIRHACYFIYGPTRMSRTIHLLIMHILHKTYRRYSYADIIHRRSYRHVWVVPKHRHIQFKIEHPDNIGSQSLQDFKMQISPNGKICLRFYRKPNTKNLFVHFKSAFSLSAKINYIRNEIKQIHNICSEEKDKITHVAHLITTLRNNDYPTSITRHLNNKKSHNIHLLYPVSWNFYILVKLSPKKYAGLFTRKG